MIFPSVAASLGVPGFSDTLGLPQSHSWVVMLIDGLGFDLLRAHVENAPFLAAHLMSEPIRCGVPSTTATSLTSLGTGLAPGIHGLVGYTCRVPETGARLNALSWDQQVDPVAWQPYPTMLARMRDTGISVNVVNDTEFAKSGLTQCAQRGVPYIGIDSTWERLEAITDASEHGPAVVYGYESRLDHCGHKYGSDSQEWVSMLATIDRDMTHLAQALDPSVGLLITADHGMVDVPREDRFDLPVDSDLRQDVSLLAGEARFRQLYTRAGAETQVASRWRERFGDRVVVRTRGEAADWFGPISANVAARIGDVLIAAADDFAIFSTADYEHEHKMKGFHGSLTRAEMLVPIIVRL